MMIKVLSLLSTLSLTTAFVPTALRQQTTSVALRMADDDVFDQEQFIAEGREMRLKYLEEQAMFALKIACENYGTLLICMSFCVCVLLNAGLCINGLPVRRRRKRYYPIRRHVCFASYLPRGLCLALPYLSSLSLPTFDRPQAVPSFPMQ